MARNKVQKEIEEVRKLAVSGHLPVSIAKLKVLDLLMEYRNNQGRYSEYEIEVNKIFSTSRAC